MESIGKLQEAYSKLWDETIAVHIPPVCATVYTQLSDVEEEVNGILTYDREVCKFERGVFADDGSSLEKRTAL